MKIGAAYPVTEVAGDPAAIRRFVTAIEALGFDHMIAYDHVVKCPHEGRDPALTGPYTDKDSFHDPFVLFAFAAALTERLEFATGVLVLPQRQTALAAQQAADVDLLSGERLRLGVGIGWNHVEFDALGQDFRMRAKRIEEQVGLLRRLWTEPLVTFEGRFDRIDNAGINPRPRRRIPLWMGGYTEPAFARGARIGDGFVFAADGRNGVAQWERVRFHLREQGRDEAGFGSDLLTLFARDQAEAADHVRGFRDAGGTHASRALDGQGPGRRDRGAHRLSRGGQVRRQGHHRQHGAAQLRRHADAAYLASDEAAYVTGQTISVNGGRYLGSA